MKQHEALDPAGAACFQLLTESALKNRSQENLLSSFHC